MRVLFVAFLLLAATIAPARAQPVDLLLVLMVDASGSIDPEEFRFQREGYADAISDERLVRAITSGRRGAIAVAFVEWGTPGGARTVIDWRRIDSTAERRALRRRDPGRAAHAAELQRHRRRHRAFGGPHQGEPLPGGARDHRCLGRRAG